MFQKVKELQVSVHVVHILVAESLAHQGPVNSFVDLEMLVFRSGDDPRDAKQAP